MNINKWLCKNFDNEKKGYVEIGDIFNEYTFIIFGLIPCLIGMFTYMLRYPNLEDLLSVEPSLLMIFIKSWIIGLAIYGIIYVLYKIFNAISKIKVVKYFNAISKIKVVKYFNAISKIKVAKCERRI